MNVKFIGEIGINHNGELENALKLVEKFNFLDYIKLQKRTPELMPESIRSRPYNNKNSFGKTYGEHKDHLELSIDDYQEIMKACQDLQIGFSASVWDKQGAKDIIKLSPDYIKIPSALCNNFNLIDYIHDNFYERIHISTGMTTKQERSKLINRSRNFTKHYVIYSCTANYQNEGPVYIENTEGFSCHRPEIFYAQAAIMKGCKFIEFHITLDRNSKGGDHQISLLPGEYKKLVTWYNKNKKYIDNIRHIKNNNIDPVEIKARNKLWTIK